MAAAGEPEPGPKWVLLVQKVGLDHKEGSFIDRKIWSQMSLKMFIRAQNSSHELPGLSDASWEDCAALVLIGSEVSLIWSHQSIRKVYKPAV